MDQVVEARSDKLMIRPWALEVGDGEYRKGARAFCLEEFSRQIVQLERRTLSPDDSLPGSPK